MIEAKTKINGEDSIISVHFGGDAREIIDELCQVVSKGAEVLTELLKEEDEEEMNYEGAFFGIIMTAIDAANEEDHDVDRKKLGMAMMVDETLNEIIKDFK